MLGVAMTVGFGGFILWGIFRKKLRDISVRFRTCPNCGARNLRLSRKIALEAGEATRGQGERHETCGSCGNDRSEIYIIPSKAEAREAKSSSSSGYGGGSSGGGGASGKW
jgi:uncharacterized protein